MTGEGSKAEVVPAPGTTRRLYLSQVLEEEFQKLHPELKFQLPAIPPDIELSKDEENARRNAVYTAIHDLKLELKQKQWALCLSGGGIRSATFCLGVLQGLASRGLLGRFDYLSTVSGGGYIGSWLTAWINRAPVSTVLEELAKNQKLNLPPEQEQIRHLRSYSNYLSPKLGLFSVDTWTLVAIYLRNLFLNWLVFIPLLMAALLLPRIYAALILRNFGFHLDVSGYVNEGARYYLSIAGQAYICLYGGLISGSIALAYIAAHRPSLRREQTAPGVRQQADQTLGKAASDPDNQKNFLRWCLFPLLVATLLLTIGRSWYLMAGTSLNLWEFTGGAALLHGLGWLLTSAIVYLHFRGKVFRNYWGDASSRSLELLIAILTGALGGLLLWVLSIPEKITRTLPAKRPELYASFDGPQLLLVFLFMGILSVGLFGGRSLTDEDREWSGRVSAWVLIVAVAWAVINSLVLFGPSALEQIWTNKGQTALTSGGILKAILIPFGIISGFVTILFGVSAKTPANDRQAEKAGRLTTVMDYAVKAAAPIFVLSLIIALSFFTDLLILLIRHVPRWYPLKSIAGWDETFPVISHSLIIKDTSVLSLLRLGGVLALISIIMAWCININEFSLHSMYRNRLIRAYLGASRKRTPNLFTGFDPDDDLRMYELWPNRESDPPEIKKPLHIVNMTWNLVQGKNLAWQDRKATTFTVSPLHCGSYLYGYRRAEEYGGKHPKSISLGTAFTISGAAASPNMGYYSSAAVTFLMTLFNARLGWWLGNPRKDLYGRSGPKWALKPMFAEALGQTVEDKEYIYLSDGGHFENLGLYEMVLRRCHTIFVIDASSDPDHKFENLGNAIRRVRVDLGVPIEIMNIVNYSKEQEPPKTYCAIGDIHYKHVDESKGTENGVLIYIKPMLTTEEPTDIFNYAKTNLKFPHESTSDQFFSEQQFESYRMLGLHAIEQIFQAPLPPNWDSGGLRQYITDYLNGFKNNESSKVGGDDGKGTEATI
ncbi:MAG TPA: patatin-like phospholipase family protein [Pyrinomonadaceae bacterium]